MGNMTSAPEPWIAILSSETQSAWTQYWRSGQTESLPEERAAGRLGALDTAWGEFLSGFSEGARLLDLATGGGDVIRRALALGRNFNITGVDIADLSTVSAGLRAQGIALVGNTDLSKLPFPDAGFDGVTSQFGIEYANLTAAAVEAVRVLAPGGRGRFVMHHADSPITQGVAKSLAAYRSVFSDSKAFQRGRTVFELRRQSAPQNAILQAEAEFRAAVGDLQSRLRVAVLQSGLREQALGAARNVIALLAHLAATPGSHPPADALRQIGGAEEQIQASTLRKTEQVKVALDRKGIAQVANHLTGAGALVDTPQELKYPLGRVLAWSLQFRK